MSQLCQGSCEPCHTFPNAHVCRVRIAQREAVSGRRRRTLVEVAVLLVGRDLAKATVRRTAVVVDVAVLGYDLGQQTLVNVTGGEGGVAEVRLFVGVVQVQLVGLSELVICRRGGGRSTCGHR